MLSAIGLAGIYIGNIFNETKNRPIYAVFLSGYIFFYNSLFFKALINGIAYCCLKIAAVV